MSKIRVVSAGRAEVGRRPRSNEDAFACDRDLHMVVDSMGGLAARVSASKLVVATVREFFADTDWRPDAPWRYKMDRSRTYEENRLVAALRLANERILAAAGADRRNLGIAATVAAVTIVDDWIYLAHVGQCRVYRRRAGQLDRLTEDHTVLNAMLQAGQLKPEEAADLPHSTIVTRAVGIAPEIAVDTQALKIELGDLYLLCSDGLWRMVDEGEISAILGRGGEVGALADALMQRANARGGLDNIAVVVIRAEEDQARG